MTKDNFGLTKSEQMYEKYLQKQSDYLPMKCNECQKVICYSYGDVSGMLDWSDVNILCEKCKRLLP